MHWTTKPPLGVPINHRHPLAKGLALYLLMNEAGGNRCYDLSGNGNHGTLTNMALPATTTSGWGLSKTGYCLVLDGSDDAVTVTGLLGQPATISVVVWENLLNNDSAGADVVSVGDNVTLRLANAGTDGAGQFSYRYATNWNAVLFTGLYKGTGWHQAVFIVAPGRSYQAVYLDGSWKVGGTYGDALVYNAGGTNTILGRHGNGGTTRDFNGMIGSVLVYSRALSPQEVAQSYYEPWGMFDTPNVYRVALPAGMIAARHRFMPALGYQRGH